MEQLLGVVGDRWSLQVVMALLCGPMRTTELVAALAPVSTRTLADRLKRLETAGVLTRHAYAEAPPRVEYALTSRGRALEPALLALRQAALEWADVECDGRPCNSCDGAPHSHAVTHRDGDRIRSTAPVDVTLL
ncbi:MAG: helix-turn-helix transcriptional regulator [Blastocatellia bacterium]|nr:helix-turn-helix transcriptional regulator [Blastocatellia bacterium]MBK6427044.1 helix-turn-helix transcriptional regulator [Blastocatellia bacterium]